MKQKEMEKMKGKVQAFLNKTPELMGNFKTTLYAFLSIFL